MKRGSKVLVTGPTGQVGGPVAKALARDHEVWALARFKDPEAQRMLEAAGVRCVRFDLAAGDLGHLASDFDYVVNMAVVKGGDFTRDMAVNAEAVGALVAHCRSAKAFLHCSSTAVYQPNGHHRFEETDPLGDNHRVLMPTYSISKIAGEVVARSSAKQWGVPTTIARLNVPYGDEGGWPAFHLDWMLARHAIPVHANRPSLYNPIHHDDIVEQVPKLLGIASVSRDHPQLGRARPGQHRAVVPVPRGADRRRAGVLLHRADSRERYDRQHADALADRGNQGRLENRHETHDGRPSSRSPREGLSGASDLDRPRPAGDAEGR